MTDRRLSALKNILSYNVEQKITLNQMNQGDKPLFFFFRPEKMILIECYSSVSPVKNYDIETFCFQERLFKDPDVWRNRVH